jgi:hypothetical protein
MQSSSSPLIKDDDEAAVGPLHHGGSADSRLSTDPET